MVMHRYHQANQPRHRIDGIEVLDCDRQSPMLLSVRSHTENDTDLSRDPSAGNSAHLMRVTTHTHHSWNTKVEGFQRKSSLIHESNEKAAQAGVDMQWNAIFQGELIQHSYREILRTDRLSYLGNLFDRINGTVRKAGCRSHKLNELHACFARLPSLALPCKCF